MTKPIMLTVNLPFEGFYNSWYSDAVDREEEQFAEYHADESGNSDKDYESYWPKPLRLDSGEYGSILFGVTECSVAYLKIAKNYVSAFDYIAGDAFDLAIKAQRTRYNHETRQMEPEEYRRPSIRATFESMDSPREYNFATDRVYADIPLAVMRELFRRSKAEKHATLSTVIKERFTSYDGFSSGYSNYLADWLSKPLADWDHNELGTLLIAALRLAGVDDEQFRSDAYDAVCGGDGVTSAWESAVDWPAFEAKRLETRAEKLAAWIEEDRNAFEAWHKTNSADYAAIVAADPSLFTAFEFTAELPYRCAETIDMFTGQPG